MDALCQNIKMKVDKYSAKPTGLADFFGDEPVTEAELGTASLDHGRRSCSGAGLRKVFS